ncbi:TetR/AcrR family transcriptional regulator [Priestia megaterium]|nr:TetR/AcrR family transcriptional regulator [Priestia megaterium]
MNKRKQHVLKNAHQLFIEKGFQATSIQDILEDSGISKGTFYNYFSSKNELVIEIFKWLYQDLEKKRNNLLIGQKLSDLEIFIQQIELQMQTHHQNKLFTLFEEVFFSNDPDLKEHIKKTQLFELQWYYNRFIDIFGEDKKPYLFDCAIMFLGILHRNFHYNFMARNNNIDPRKVIRYSVERLVHMVNEVSQTNAQLLDPSLLKKWVPRCENETKTLEQQITDCIITLKKAKDKKSLTKTENQKLTELLDFIQEEVIHQPFPRKFILESAIHSLNQSSLAEQSKLRTLQTLIQDYLKDLE